MPSTRRASAAERAVQDARALILSTNYIELASARSKLEQLLAEWVHQQATTTEEERLPTQNESAGSMKKSARAGEIAALWVMYAQLDCDLRQFGHAASVFERAVACPVAGQEPSVWTEYARFCAERSRLANARKVFKRGLKTLQGKRREALLQSFHAFAANYMGVALPFDAFRQCVFPTECATKAHCTDLTPSKGSSSVRLSLECDSIDADLARASSGFHQIWFAAINQLELPSPATVSTVSSMNVYARHEDDYSMSSSSTDDPAASDDQDEARPAERVDAKPKATTTRSGRVSVPKKPFEASRSGAEKERLRLRAERRREQVECEFCHQFFSRASKRSHSIRCKLKLGVTMSAEDRLVASAFLEKERRKRARTYRNRKARERTSIDE